MNCDSNYNYFLVLLVACVVTNVSGKYPSNFGLSYDPERNISLQINQCDETRTRTEFRILQEANNFNATYKNLVIIIGLNGTDAVNLAKFLTNDNQTVLNSRIPVTGVEYSPSESAQQHLHQYFDKSEETAFYVHPGESLQDDYLVDGFLAKKVIDYAEKVKIILTCRIIDGVDRLFQVAHKILPKILKYENHMLLVATRGTAFDEKMITNQKSVIEILENMSRINNSLAEIAKFIITHRSYIEITSFSDLVGKQIKKYIRNLRFANSSITDFKYSLSINSTQELRAICVCYYKPAFLITSGSLVIDDVISHLELIKNNTDRRNVTQVRQYAKTMEKCYTYILSVDKEIKNKYLKTSHDFFNHIREMVKNLNFTLSEYSSRYLYTLQEPVYNYLFDIGLPVQLETDIWFHGFESFLNKYLPSHKYYESFLKFSDIDLFNAVIDEQMEHRLSDMFTHVENSSLILEKSPFEVEAFESLKLSVYNRKIAMKCIRMNGGNRNYKVEVRGDIVSMSYVKNYTCQNVRYIEIYALEMVVIDEDLNLQDEKVEVGIVAPTWLIVGNRTIDLSGTDGKNWETAANSGTTDGSKLGTHGNPGRPGGSAGHFYAIAEKMINGRNLFVIAAGGKGGSGQGGGNGAKGDDGKSYEYIKDQLEIRSWWKVAKSRPREILSFPLQTSQYNVIFGKPGQRGGRGGDGGIGGEGGKSGDVKIVQLEKNSNNFVKYFNLPGKKGAMGIGGKGGPGGVNGNNLHVAFVKTHLNYKHTTRSELRKNETQGNAPRGLNGLTGGNFMNRTQSESVQKIQDFPRIVNNYKNYARENFDPLVRKDKLQNFYDLLNNNTEIIEAYTVLDLIEEFLDLERQFTSLADITVLFPSYESLLYRTEYYEKKIIRENTTSDNIMIPISSMKTILRRKTNNNKKHGNYAPQFSMTSLYDVFMSKYESDMREAAIAQIFNEVQELPLNWNIVDIRVRTTYAILKQLYDMNSFKEAYSEWLYAFKQFVFPEIQYIDGFPPVFNNYFDLKTLKDEIVSTNIMISTGQFDLNVYKTAFRRNLIPDSTPFAMWNNKKYAKQIRSFLSGEKVSFFANISSLEINVVKFNRVNLSFYSEDETVLQNFISDIRYFRVQLTHEGDSYYNCNGSTFLIRNSPTNMIIGYNPLSEYKDNEYERLAGNDYVLSPYATWTMRLINTTQVKNFNDMSGYKGKIDLELEGIASVYDKSSCDRAKLSELYELVDGIQ